VQKIMNRIELNDLSLTVFYIIGITSLIVMEAYIRLLTPFKVLTRGVASTYDVMIHSDMYTIPLFIMPFIMYYIIKILKNEFNAMRVVRNVNIRNIWLGCIKELLVIDAIFTVYICIITIIAGVALTGKMCNWNEVGSFGYNIAGKTIDIYPSVIYMIVTYMISIFSVIFIFGIIILYIWWYLKSPVAGMIVAYGILFIEGAVYLGNVFWGRYMMSFRIYKYGIDVFNEIIYPIILCIILFLISTLLIKRRDFLDKL